MMYFIVTMLRLQFNGYLMAFIWLKNHKLKLKKRLYGEFTGLFSCFKPGHAVRVFLINWRSLRGRVTPWSGTYGNTPYNRGLPFQDSPDWWTEADGFGRSPTDSSCLTNSHLINRSWCLFKLRFLYFNHSPLEISKLKNLKIFWNSEIQKKWSKNLLKKEKMLNRSIILTRTNFKNFSTLHNMKWTKFSDKDNNALLSNSCTL